ncbi:MAG: rhomboid family intramembrane serine protease [Campylobacterota bacterium]|nr:rhomboid family intramembrane serine protease [Campylobacterota bacterium]
MRTNQIITATNIIILLNLLMFGIQNMVEHGILRFGLNIYFFEYELYYQLLSSMFVHSGTFHILMNMFVLYQFGSIIEEAIGVKRYLFIYFIGGVLTSVLSLVYMNVTGNWANLVGASGAISVLFGWYALRVPSERTAIIIWIVLISFAPLFLGFPIAWYAHIIGFVLGWIIGYII